MNLVDEEHVPPSQPGEQPDQIARLLQHRPRRGAKLDPHLPRHQHRQGGFAEPGGTEKEDVVERVLPGARRVDRDLERGLHLLLTHELIQPRGAERRVGGGLVRERVWCGDLETGHGTSNCVNSEP